MEKWNKNRLCLYFYLKCLPLKTSHLYTTNGMVSVLVVVFRGLGCAYAHLVTMLLCDTMKVLMSRMAHDGLYPCRRLSSTPGLAFLHLSSFTSHLLRGLAQHLGPIAADLGRRF